jgi:hypothetical protein
MVTIQLRRSGGQLGKTLQATHQIDIDEEDIIEKLKAVAPVNNPDARDDFYYSVTINKKKAFPIDITLLKGGLKKIISTLENNLKVEGD